MLENWSYASRYLEPLQYFTGNVHVWRIGAGRLVGAAIRYWELAWPQLLPAYRFLEDRIFGWVEQNWAGDESAVGTMVYDWDTGRQELLRRRGYEDQGAIEIVRIYDLARETPAPVLPPGYRFATLAQDRRTAERVALENSVWGTTLDEAWFRGKSSAPHYSFDSDLLVLSPEGVQAAFCLVWLDEESGIGEIDPIGTHPAHRRRGLARALMAESLRRMRAAGMRVGCVACEADSSVVNELYSSFGPAETYLGNRWVKRCAVL